MPFCLRQEIIRVRRRVRSLDPQLPQLVDQYTDFTLVRVSIRCMGSKRRSYSSQNTLFKLLQPMYTDISFVFQTMSRGSVDEHSLRQHRGRLLQLAESAGSLGSKRRSYSSQHTLFKSLQQMSPSPRIATKLLSLEEVVRKDPGYTPNIEHLVFPSRKNSMPSNIPVLAGKSGKTSARAKLAEVFALSRHQSARGKHSSSSQQSTDKSTTLGSRGSQRKSNKVRENFEHLNCDIDV
ncbi:hypothetical protein J6590_045051 [Homalodisca vitripennis]|nr:hypothetical protein J6590_045051 [Homalodisca vitripennis]